MVLAGLQWQETQLRSGAMVSAVSPFIEQNWKTVRPQQQVDCSCAVALEKRKSGEQKEREKGIK